ncbi:esterase/lipase family protein [Haliangium sp.]|uniref:esterase/lipase family protein n=1 Tax=Haliangium sp. TaxID=2663208 RepID=UPI003D09E139
MDVRRTRLASSSALGRVLLAAAALLPLSACPGGGGGGSPDAAPSAPDAASTAPDATPGAPDATPLSACAMAMQNAPTGASAPSFQDALPTATVNTWDSATIPTAGDANYPGGKYRTLEADGNGDIHPGCSTAGLSYTPATITDYPCAAKEYPFPNGVSEDTGKPIVLLIHGNSDSPAEWEAFLHPDPTSVTPPFDTEARDQLAELLPAAGYRTIAVDLRIDLVDDPGGTTGNVSKNIDHGWATPIAQRFIKQVIIANPNRKISLIGFSLGSTIVRDALRRLFVQFQDGDWDINVFSRVQDVILASGGHHGVSSYNSLCGTFTTMNGTAACEFGQRNTYTQVAFHEPLNGPALTGAGEPFGGWYETPCADGDYAFGVRDACGDNEVEYTTVTMMDLNDGQQQDEFVSEHASRLYPDACADNVLNTLNDFDTSGYFFNGLLRNHFGGVRSNASHTVIMNALAD